jgi:hypothetical protein
VRAAAVAIAILAAACVKPSASFTCDSSAECTVGGTCQPATGFCSFADGACASGQRYGDAAGDLSNVCVGDEPVVDASDIDAPPGTPDGRADAMVDAEPACPAPFVESPNGCHGFFQPMTAAYDAGRAFCEGMGADLAVIETVAESNYIGSTALVPGSAERALMGLDFRSGTWTWVDGSGLTLTNWSAGEPGAGENVAVIRPDGLWAGRLDTEPFFIVCER